MKTSARTHNFTMFVLISGTLVLSGCCKQKSTPENYKPPIFSENGRLYMNANPEVDMFSVRADSVFGLYSNDSIGLFIKDKRYGYLNVNNSGVVIPAKYDLAWQFNDSGSVAAVVAGGKMGFIGRNGNYLVEPRFDFDTAYFNDYDFTYSDDYCYIPGQKGKFGIINRRFQVVVSPIYDNIEIDGNYFIIWDAGKAGIADTSGNIILKPEFDNIDVIRMGFVIYNEPKNEKYVLDFDGITTVASGVFDFVYSIRSSRSRSDEYYDDENIYVADSIPVFYSLNYAKFEISSLQGVIHRQSGKIVCPAKWDDVFMLSEDVLVGVCDDYYFIIDIK
ncbi:MAG TPA: WG repeat-containing protein [Bacteroidales bacterium]|nr:WG repeat-containing protein [Bacteroidales bacterium]